MKPTVLVIVTLVILALGSSVWFLAEKYFAPVIHRSASSPDGVYQLVITKRLSLQPNPVRVEVHVSVEKRTHGSVFLYGADLWEDVRGESFSVDYIGDGAFAISDQWGSFSEGHRLSVKPNQIVLVPIGSGVDAKASGHPGHPASGHPGIRGQLRGIRRQLRTSDKLTPNPTDNP